MRILILGGSGMLGHRVYQRSSSSFETYVTFRSFERYKKYKIFNDSQVIDSFVIENDKAVGQVFEKIQPDYVINCIGITKHQLGSNNSVEMIAVNALFPHRISLICEKTGAKLIHISTDCIFSGKKGMYKEDDEPDAYDLYGRSKLLGEVKDNQNVLTIRTSIIGRELSSSFGLVEWFFANRGKTVKGFNKAIFSGFTTKALAEIIIGMIEKNAKLNGLYHISAEPINKFDLLTMIKNEFDLDIKILPDNDFLCDRSLDSSKYRKETGFNPLSWENMVKDVVDEYKQYDKWRKL